MLQFRVMNALVIVNPTAGGRSRVAPGRREAIARAALARAGVDGEVVLTERAGHGREIAQAAVDSGCELVVAWGGDGTINEVASALVGRNATLGIVRAGSGNGFARELGVPSRPALALDAALGGQDCVIDTGEIDGRFFVNIAGIGFDALMAARFDELGPERRGSIRYAASVLRSFYAYRPAEYAIEAGRRAVEHARADRRDRQPAPVRDQRGHRAAGRAVRRPARRGGHRGTRARSRGSRWCRGPFDRSIRPRSRRGVPDGAPDLSSRPTRPMAYHVDGEPCFAAATGLEARIRPQIARSAAWGARGGPIFRLFRSRYTRYMTMNTEARDGAPAGADAASGAAAARLHPGDRRGGPADRQARHGSHPVSARSPTATCTSATRNRSA